MRSRRSQTLPKRERPGTAHIDFHLTKDAAGTITAATVDFRVDLTGFPGTSAITAAHIHPGAAGTSGPVLVTADVAAGQVTLTNGVGTFTRINLALGAANAQAKNLSTKLFAAFFIAYR